MKIIYMKDIPAADAGSQPLFTGGKVTTQPVLDEDLGTKHLQIVNVRFAAGAKNRFHTHTKKQILFVTEGKGIVATREKEYVVTPGTTVIIPPGEEHWHGATEESSFAHLSIIGLPQEMKITG